MHAVYGSGVDARAYDLTAWFNIVGALGCIFWVIAYVAILKKCFDDKAYGLPLVAICLNFGWEILASFVIPNPVNLWRFFDRAWLAIDVVLVGQLLTWGRGYQSIPEIRRWFVPVVVGTFILGVVGQYTFVDVYRDKLGLLAAFIINLVMSVLFVFLYFARRADRRGLSVVGAWCKMLGTLGTSIECHFVVGIIDNRMPHLWFLTYLSVVIFFFDCLYIYLVSRTEPEPAPPAPAVMA